MGGAMWPWEQGRLQGASFPLSHLQLLAPMDLWSQRGKLGAGA